MEQPPNLITVLLLAPILGSLFIAFLPPQWARQIAIWFSVGMVAISGWMAYTFVPDTTGYQFEQAWPWIEKPIPIVYHVGVDGLSLVLVLMTTLITLFSVLASYSIKQREQLYYAFVMLLTLSILGVFVSLDLLQFFVLYELELVPMYFLIAIWGGSRRGYAAMKFLIYTFFGGVLMLAALLYTYQMYGFNNPGTFTFDMRALAARCQFLPAAVQSTAFLGFFLAFIIKLPSFPFHTWLPDAHVEAPTPISMILAGLLLKMGGYGLVRICLGFFPQVFVDYGNLIMYLGCFNIVWAAVACLVQQDMKRIIAYSSVSHMGFVLLGLGSISAAALSGAIFQMVSHGFVSAALFFLVGCVYERCHTRLLPEIGGGLARQMPILFYFWMLATMANLGLPGLSGFVGEVTVFYGSFISPVAQVLHPHLTRIIIAVACSSVILTAGYMLWLLKRLFYGPEQQKWIGHLTDATKTEQLVGWGLAVFIVGLGICPMMLTQEYKSVADLMTNSIANHMNISMKQGSL